ncbi:hypothetical protein GCK72_014212 [Caenorhabditis remanei]|uniref:Uncharacterized protein n=1 Tax=Caenorhabditis remanei TaxID=31234 RepID=A0A6A5GT43_CAERE|nr:hypothetical protein GCK72_014212 [Caenorhabditis remanei]KAF1757756.1 hypothetical protein GCK72_014212 [Caenorhabditis remanei]
MVYPATVLKCSRMNINGNEKFVDDYVDLTSTCLWKANQQVDQRKCRWNGEKNHERKCADAHEQWDCREVCDNDETAVN